MGSGGTPRHGDGLRAAENRTFRFAMAPARTTLSEFRDRPVRPLRHLWPDYGTPSLFRLGSFSEPTLRSRLSRCQLGFDPLQSLRQRDREREEEVYGDCYG